MNTQQHELYVTMLDNVNSRIAELEGQALKTQATLIALQVPSEKIASILAELEEISGLNAKRAEAARIRYELQNN